MRTLSLLLFAHSWARLRLPDASSASYYIILLWGQFSKALYKGLGLSVIVLPGICGKIPRDLRRRDQDCGPKLLSCFQICNQNNLVWYGAVS